MSDRKKILMNKIVGLLNEASDLQVENECIRNDSATTKRMFSNSERMEKIFKEVDDLMGELDQYGDPGRISSRDGSFVAYKKTVAQSGVDIDRLLETGIIDWFYNNAKQYLSLDLIRIRDELGLDLSAYALRPERKIFTVSKDEDYRYMMDIISKYVEAKREGA